MSQTQSTQSTASVPALEKVTELRPYRSPTRDIIERLLRNNSARLGGIIVILYLLTAVLVPVFDHYDALRDRDLRARLKAPDCLIGWVSDHLAGKEEIPSLFEYPCEHPFGCDDLGRDVLRRVGHGASVSLGAGVVAVAISLIIGASIGELSGFAGGWVDSVFMRIMDIMLAFPTLLLAIAIVAVRGEGLVNAMIAIGVVGIPTYARLARSMAISLREEDFVMAAEMVGASNWRILRVHILPNSLAPLIVQSTLGMGTAVVETAALGFLGLGQQPPYPELGKMLADSQQYLSAGKWWAMLFPGLAIMLSVLGFNLLGDGLRDTLDPRLRGVD